MLGMHSRIKTGHSATSLRHPGFLPFGFGATLFRVRCPFACRNGKTLFRGGWKVLLDRRNDGAISAPTFLSTNAIAMTKDPNEASTLSHLKSMENKPPRRWWHARDLQVPNHSLLPPEVAHSLAHRERHRKASEALF